MSSLIDLGKGPLILLLYDGYERRAAPGVIGGLQSEARRVLRYVKRSLLRQQVRTGFYTAFLSLYAGLKAIGCDVRVNDFTLAKKYSSYPIGVAGYPSVLDKIALSNPRILGPGDFGTPADTAALAGEVRNAVLIEPSDWFCDVYRPFWGEKMWTWFAGIDTSQWRDAAAHDKTIDVLLYDKIRWHRDALVPALLTGVTAYLEQQGLTYKILRYGEHHHVQFRKTLQRARTMIFLCEHETQGLAYQEALAMNVPVLAWDEGKIIDPILSDCNQDSSRVSSVPYFDARCGLTFTRESFEETWQRFWQERTTYQPRRYVEEVLSLEIAARNYLAKYAALAAA